VSPKAKIALVFAVCAAPLVLGTLAYVYGWGTGGAGNYGELIAPRPLAGAPFEALRGRWVLVTVDAAACGAACEKKLYFVRQVRRAQGGEAERIERLWLVTDRGAPRPELVRAIEGARIVASDADTVRAFPGNPAEHIYLVDPLGNLMMRYPQEPDPSKMIKDLQRLLKYSRIG
jgi:hypothetical protein